MDKSAGIRRVSEAGLTKYTFSHFNFSVLISNHNILNSFSHQVTKLLSLNLLKTKRRSNKYIIFS